MLRVRQYLAGFESDGNVRERRSRFFIQRGRRSFLKSILQLLLTVINGKNLTV